MNIQYNYGAGSSAAQCTADILLLFLYVFFYLPDCLRDNGTGPIMLIVLFLVSYFNFFCLFRVVD